MKYIRKPIEVEAVQWFKLGDHPNVCDFVPVYNPDTLCDVCSNPISKHGLLMVGFYYEKGIIHPGDWLVTDPNGEITVLSDKEFHEQYGLDEYEIVLQFNYDTL